MNTKIVIIPEYFLRIDGRKKTHTVRMKLRLIAKDGKRGFMLDHNGVERYVVCLDLRGAECTSRWKTQDTIQGPITDVPAGKFGERTIEWIYDTQPRLLGQSAYIRVAAIKGGKEVFGAKQSLEWELIKQNGKVVGLNMLTGETVNEASGILEGVKRNPPKRKPPVVKDNTPDDLPDGYLEAAKKTNWNIINPQKNYLIKTLRVTSFEPEDINHIPQLTKRTAQSFHNRVAIIKNACGNEITFRQVMNEIRTQVRKKAGVYGNVEELQKENDVLKKENDVLKKKNAELKENLKEITGNNDALRDELADRGALIKRYKTRIESFGPHPIGTDSIKTLLGSIERHLTSTELGRTGAWVLAQSKACLQGRTKPGWRLKIYLNRCSGTDDRIFDRLKKFWGLG